VWIVPVQNQTGSSGVHLNPTDKGVHFFAPAPYVWITSATLSDKVNIAEVTRTTNEPTGTAPKAVTVERGVSSKAEPAYVMEVVFLPDPTHEYALQWKAGLFGSIQPKCTLDKGWNLVGFESVINSGLSGTIALSGQAQMTKALSFDGGTFKDVGLYKLAFDVRRQMWTLGEKVFP
jgi:hypothetical protein